MLKTLVYKDMLPHIITVNILPDRWTIAPPECDKKIKRYGCHSCLFHFALLLIDLLNLNVLCILIIL